MNTHVTSGYPPNYKALRQNTWDKLAPYWAIYTHRDSFHHKAESRLLDAVIRCLALQSIHQVSLLDLGCGTGAFLRLARRHVQPDGQPPFAWKRLVGLDFCAELLKIAREDDMTGVPRLAFYKADLELPIATELSTVIANFDIITACFLIDEIEALDVCFESAARLVRPGGHFVCATLDCETDRRRFSSEIAAVGQGTGPLVIRRPLVGPEVGRRDALFRVLREVEEINQVARRHKFVLLQNTVVSPKELEARLDGPSLRLFTWQRVAP